MLVKRILILSYCIVKKWEIIKTKEVSTVYRPQHRVGKSVESGKLLPGKFDHLEGNCDFSHQEIHKTQAIRLRHARAIAQGSRALNAPQRVVYIVLRYLRSQKHCSAIEIMLKAFYQLPLLKYTVQL